MEYESATQNADQSHDAGVVAAGYADGAMEDLRDATEVEKRPDSRRRKSIDHRDPEQVALFVATLPSCCSHQARF